jgi:hypothetical protein
MMLTINSNFFGSPTGNFAIGPPSESGLSLDSFTPLMKAFGFHHQKSEFHFSENALECTRVGADCGEVAE